MRTELISSPSNSNYSNVSLVAFYQNKPSQLATLIDELQTCLHKTSVLNQKFQSYQLEQVHGTIIGCEGLRTESGIINKWFLENRQEIRYIDLEGLSEYFRSSDRLPLTLRFGGYNSQFDYGFVSRYQHPFIRSFQLQPSTAGISIAVLVGWAFRNNSISWAIDNLRRDAQKFNCLHKYHTWPTTIDNDFYLRLGIVREDIKPNEIAFIQAEIRNILQTKVPIYIALKQNNLAFVKYQNLSLPVATTEMIDLQEATKQKLDRFYT